MSRPLKVQIVERARQLIADEENWCQRHLALDVNGAVEPAEKPKSELYRDLLPLINSGAVEILDNERLIAQLVSLERRTARGGKESIDHAPGAHDDVANAVAGALVTAYKEPG